LTLRSCHWAGYLRFTPALSTEGPGPDHEASRLGMIGEDVELLEGVIFRKTAESPLHEWLIEFFKRHLEAVVFGAGETAVGTVFPALAVRVDEVSR